MTHNHDHDIRPKPEPGSIGLAFGQPITVVAVDEADDRATIQHADGTQSDVWFSAARTYCFGKPSEVVQ